MGNIVTAQEELLIFDFGELADLMLCLKVAGFYHYSCTQLPRYFVNNIRIGMPFVKHFWT
jgi:hypothetical protein